MEEQDYEFSMKSYRRLILSSVAKLTRTFPFLKKDAFDMEHKCIQLIKQSKQSDLVEFLNSQPIEQV